MLPHPPLARVPSTFHPSPHSLLVPPLQPLYLWVVPWHFKKEVGVPWFPHSLHLPGKHATQAAQSTGWLDHPGELNRQTPMYGAAVTLSPRAHPPSLALAHSLHHHITTCKEVEPPTGSPRTATSNILNSRLEITSEAPTCRVCVSRGGLGAWWGRVGLQACTNAVHRNIAALPSTETHFHLPERSLAHPWHRCSLSPRPPH